jgi:hypothetical protein
VKDSGVFYWDMDPVTRLAADVAWQTFLNTSVDQILTLTIPLSKPPVKTRGKTVTVTSLTVLAVGWPPGKFTLAPQAPMATPALRRSVEF